MSKHSRLSPIVALIAAVVVSVAIAGCGSSGSTTEYPNTLPTYPTTQHGNVPKLDNLKNYSKHIYDEKPTLSNGLYMFVQAPITGSKDGNQQSYVKVTNKSQSVMQTNEILFGQPTHPYIAMSAVDSQVPPTLKPGESAEVRLPLPYDGDTLIVTYKSESVEYWWPHSKNEWPKGHPARQYYD